MSVDPRPLLHLLAIHEHGSLSGAAQALGLSQPALSNSIALLERRLEARVLTRTGRGATVNEFGAILVRRSRELRSLLKAAEEEVRLRRKGQLGPLSIGATPSIVEQLIPRALHELRRDKSTSLSITVVEGLDGPLDAALLDGELDLVVGAVGRPAPPADLTEEFLLADPFVLAVGLESPLAGREEVSLVEARNYPWILPRPGGSAHAHIHAVFLNAGVPWPDDCTSTNSATLTKRLISQSDAVALVNVLTLAGWDVPVTAIRLTGAGVRNVGIRRRKIGELTALAERFLTVLRNVSTQFVPEVVLSNLRGNRRRTRRPLTHDV
jgi:LysR family transcriptional regulator, regulator of abg operon